MKARERNQAFDLILAGQPIRTVAQTVGVSRSSIERWSVQYGWMGRRRQFQKEMQEKSQTQLANEKLAALKLRSEKLFQVFDEEFGKWIAYRDGKVRKPGLSILKIARIAEVATRLNIAEVELLAAKYQGR